MPPLIVLAGPRWERYARDVPTAGTWTLPRIQIHEDAGGYHDENDAQYKAGETDEYVAQARPKRHRDAEEVGREAFHRAQSAKEPIHHPAEVGEVIDEGGQTDEAVNHYVE